MRDLRLGSIGTRWLGVGLASIVAVVTLGLALTGRLALYINPDGAWFAVGMAVVTLIGAVASFTLPLGAEADHGHDHGTVHRAPVAVVDPVGARRTPSPPVAAVPVPTAVEVATPDVEALVAQGMSRREIREILAAAEGAHVQHAPDADAHAHTVQDAHAHAVHDSHAHTVHGAHAHMVDDGHADGAHAGAVRVQHASAAHGHDAHADGHAPRSALGLTAAIAGGVVASVVALGTLVLPPASLSVELAMSRDLGVAPLFAGADVVQLASTGDLTSFGIGEWATVFQTAPNLDAYDGAPVKLTGFVVPGADGELRLSRLVVTHCVIDAQPAGVPVQSPAADYTTGQWVQVDGTITAGTDGRLAVTPDTITKIDEPADPYEY